jgi:colanic acid biosynthesis glycosyl transferase WcaI
VTRARVVFTAADLWPESFAATGVVGNGLVMRIAAWYSRLINRVAHDVICVTRGIAARYAADGISSERLPVVRVWVDGCPAEAAPRSPSPGIRRIVYAGNLGAAQPIDTIIRAAALLERDGCAVHFDIYGTGVDAGRLRDLSASLGLRSVTLHGAVSPDEAFAASSTATGQIVTLRPSPLFRMTVPSKLYFCAGAATPIVYALEGEAHDMLTEIGGGIAFEAVSPESLRDAIQRLLALDESAWHRMSTALAARYNLEFRKSVLLERYRILLLGEPATRGLRSSPLRSPPDHEVG